MGLALQQAWGSKRQGHTALARTAGLEPRFRALQLTPQEHCSSNSGDCPSRDVPGHKTGPVAVPHPLVNGWTRHRVRLMGQILTPAVLQP